MKRECCKVDNNLGTEILGKNRTVRICRVCGRRHFTLDAEAGVYSLRGAPGEHRNKMA